MNCYAFAICFKDKYLFSILYFVRWGSCHYLFLFLFFFGSAFWMKHGCESDMGFPFFSFVCDALDGWFARKLNQG